MTSYVPPPYAPGETKELMYPSVHDDPQQQQQPLGVYPQQGSPAAPGMASVTYYPPGPQQQQPQQLVISQPAPVVVQSQQQQRVQAFAWHVAVSCCVVFCCCCPCGLLAFILAMCGHCYAQNSPSSARCLGTASIVFSVIGLVIGVLVLVAAIIVSGGVAAFYAEFVKKLQSLEGSEICKYYIDGDCYSYRTPSTSSVFCEGDGHYSNDWCYH